MAETRDQKREWDGISLPLSNSSGRPSKRVDRDEWKTWSTLDLLSAENAGSPQQGRNPLLTVNRNRTVWLFIRADFGLLKLREMLMGRLMCAIAVHGHHIQNDAVVDHAVDGSHYVGWF